MSSCMILIMFSSGSVGSSGFSSRRSFCIFGVFFDSRVAFFGRSFFGSSFLWVFFVNDDIDDKLIIAMIGFYKHPPLDKTFQEPCIQRINLVP